MFTNCGWYEVTSDDKLESHFVLLLIW